MKKITAIVITTLLISCAQTQTPVESSYIDEATTEVWAPVFSNNNDQLNKTIYLSKEIDGESGGSITYCSKEYDGFDLDYQLKFYPGSFDGTKTVTTILDDNSFSILYTPNENFHKPALLSITLHDADLSFLLNDDHLHFGYSDQEGKLMYNDDKEIKTNPDEGTIHLMNFELPYFASRYGFTR